MYYCDARQSQQKGGCERNHVELRKILPKGRGISFDRLSGRDCAVLMSHLIPSPRPSLGGMCAVDMLLAAYGDDGQALLDALGIEKVPYGGLLMSPGAIERARRERGRAPLAPPRNRIEPLPKPVRMSSRANPRGPAEPCPEPIRTAPEAREAQARTGKTRDGRLRARPLTAGTPFPRAMFG